MCISRLDPDYATTRCSIPADPSRIARTTGTEQIPPRERTANFLIDGSVAVPGTGLEGRRRDMKDLISLSLSVLPV